MSLADPSLPPTETGLRLLADLRAEIAHADSKASVLVGAIGMTFGVIGGVLGGRAWSPEALSWPAATAWWAGAAALAVALVALVMTVLPRYRASGWVPGRPLTYFGDIQQAAVCGRLADALADTERDATGGLVTALTETSRIAARKHQWLRVGLLAFGSSALLLPGSLLIG